jgi:hypothetical protein
MGHVEEGGNMYEIFLSFKGIFLQYFVLPNPFPLFLETGTVAVFKTVHP